MGRFFNKYTVRFLTALGAGGMVFGITGAFGSGRYINEFAVAAGVGAGILARGLIELIKPE